MNTHRQYINEQIKKEPKFAEARAKAEQEVGIAVELARLWERRGFSQTENAKLTGMKQPQIAHLESGAHFPAFSTLQKLLGVLGGKLELTADACHPIPTPTKGRQREAVVRPQHPECRQTSKSQWRETMKHRAARRHRHLQLDQGKLTRATTVLGDKTETEAIERALALVVEEHTLDQPLKRAKGRMQLRKVYR